MDRLNPRLAASLGTAAVVDVAAPIVLAVFLARRLGGRWRWWWVGFAVFLLFQGVTRVPAMIVLGQAQWGGPTALLAVEGLVAAYAVLAVWYVVRGRPRAGPMAPVAGDDPG